MRPARHGEGINLRVGHALRVGLTVLLELLLQLLPAIGHLALHVAEVKTAWEVNSPCNFSVFVSVDPDLLLHLI